MILRYMLATAVLLMAMTSLAAHIVSTRYTSESVEDPKIYNAQTQLFV